MVISLRRKRNYPLNFLQFKIQFRRKVIMIVTGILNLLFFLNCMTLSVRKKSFGDKDLGLIGSRKGIKIPLFFIFPLLNIEPITKYLESRKGALC